MNNPHGNMISFQERLEARRKQVQQQREAERMSPLGASLSRVPDSVFARIGHTTREAAVTKCKKCGDIEPLAVEQGWLRRECDCERAARYELNNILAAQENARNEAERSAKETSVDRCYTWLGEDYSEYGLETLCFEDYHPDSIVLSEAKTRAELFAFEPVGTLIFHGSWGVGKTHLACAILNALRAEGKPGLFTTGPNLFNAIQARMDDDKGYQDILAAMYKTPLLVIDDIDKARATDYRVQVYTEVLNKRTNRNLATIITTNIAMKSDAMALKVCIGEAAASRLNKGLVLVRMVGNDFRTRMIGE